MLLQMAGFPSLMTDLYIYTHTYHILLIHVSTDRHLGGLHVLAVITNTAVNMGCRGLPRTLISLALEVSPEVRLQEHVLALLLTSWASILFFTAAAPTYVPTNSAQGIPLSHPCLLWQPFWQVWGDISLWSWFAFPWWLSIFSCVHWPFVCLWKNVHSEPLLIC